MSTDGSGEQPLTRAQLRALRAEQTSPEAPQDAPDPVEESSPTFPQIPEPHQEAPEAVEGPPPTFPQIPEAPRVATEPAEEPALTFPEVPEPVEGPAAPPAPPASTRRFRLALFASLGVLALIVATLGAVSLVQGPRLSSVDVNEAQAIDTSGSRVILTANQSLAAIDPEQVTVEPAVPFTVDAAGRNVGIRFTVPLDDSTTYTVKVAGVSSSGGGPSADLSTTFHTPASTIFLLQRGSGDEDDKIFSTDLTGESGVPVFTHPRISDFRATPELLVVAVEDAGGEGSRLLVMRRDGSGQRELELPGDGYISSVQVSDRGGLVGYSYSDRELTDTTGRASVLVTQPLSGNGEPRIVQVAGEDASVADWQFVPDSSSLLFIDFDGALAVEDPTGDAGVQSMGLAASILGINRGTYTAIVELNDASYVQLDLTTGETTPLEASDPDYGPATTIVPLPDGTLRHVVQRTESGMPTGQAVIRVDDDGKATPIAEVSGTDAILQVCASPSGQYAAITIAPDLPSNDYDDLLLPLPTTLHTQLIDLSDGSTMVTLEGFDVSWCSLAPSP